MLARLPTSFVDGETGMKSTTGKISRGIFVIGMLLAGGLSALPASAASERLDAANAHLVKATALINAAAYAGEPQSVVKQRQQAVRLIAQARRAIARAKQAADASLQNPPGLHAAPRIAPPPPARLH